MATKTQTVGRNVPFTLLENTFTRTHYTFKGWTDTSGGTTVKYTDKQANVTFNDNKTLYAVWQEFAKYTVKFLKLDGTTLSQQTVYQGDSAVEPTPPYIAGKKFSAWNTDNWKNVQSNLTVTPIYVDDLITITYNSNY